jgi:hypothetical protein
MPNSQRREGAHIPHPGHEGPGGPPIPHPFESIKPTDVRDVPKTTSLPGGFKQNDYTPGPPPGKKRE